MKAHRLLKTLIDAFLCKCHTNSALLAKQKCSAILLFESRQRTGQFIKRGRYTHVNTWNGRLKWNRRQGNMEDTIHEISAAEAFRTKDPDKRKLKPEIDDKHRQRNEKLLSKKRQSIAIAGTTKLSSTNPLTSGHLALSRQKEVEVFDSHAIDFGQVRKPKTTDAVLDNAFLPRHLRKRLGSLQNGHEVNSAPSLRLGHSRLESAIDEVNSADESVCLEASLKVVNESFDGRKRMSIISAFNERISGKNSVCIAGGSGEQHDTLESFMKYRRESLDKDERLRRVQEQARVVDTESNEPIVKSLAYRKKYTLPPLAEYDAEPAKIHSRKKERYKLPKLKTAKKVDTRNDPRFEKLLSSLVPQDKRNADFQRRRHYTL